MIVLSSPTRSLLALSPILTRPSGDADNSGNPRGGRTHGRNKEEGKLKQNTVWIGTPEQELEVSCRLEFKLYSKEQN